MHLKVILGSTREGRFSDKPGRWIASLAGQGRDWHVEVLDLRDYPMPFFNEKETPGHKSKPYADTTVAAWTAKIAEGDAFLIVAPEYNHGYSAVLKNAIDWVYQEWNKKPVSFVSYGSAMGARSVEQLRQVAVELQMAPLRSGVHIPWDTLAKVAGFGGAPDPNALAIFDERAGGMLGELAWWGRALKEARATT